MQIGCLPLAWPSAVASVASDKLVLGLGQTKCKSSLANNKHILPAYRIEPLLAISLST